MKTQNTLENKARFFAQYFGQHVLYFSSDFLRKIDNLTLDSVENDDYLELKPLSQISDEETIHIARVCHQVPNSNFEVKTVITDLNVIHEVMEQIFNYEKVRKFFCHCCFSTTFNTC